MLRKQEKFSKSAVFLRVRHSDTAPAFRGTGCENKQEDFPDMQHLDCNLSKPLMPRIKCKFNQLDQISKILTGVDFQSKLYFNLVISAVLLFPVRC